MSSEINSRDSEATPWRWSDKIEEIRKEVVALTPEYLDRYDELVWLRARLLDYVEAIEATILGYDPSDPETEAVFGDTTLMETIEVIMTLPTVPADISRLLAGAQSPDGDEPESAPSGSAS